MERERVATGVTNNNLPLIDQQLATTTPPPRAQVGPEQGAFLGWLVGTLGATRVIEVRACARLRTRAH